jgi:HEPN domain-containing protein
MSDQPLPSQTPIKWVGYAEGELRVAETSFNSDAPSYPTICFLCQSSAEKFVKAYLISQGWDLQKIHDIVKLIKISTNYTDKLKEMEDKGDILNMYITAGRYPQRISSEEISRDDAEEAIESAQAIRMRVMELMAKDDEKK